MERWAGRVAVVTGASSGIGASIAEALAREGMIVVGLARRKNRLQDTAEALSIAKGKLYPVQCDVSNEQEILDAFRWIRDHLGAIDVLVNNAGVAHFAHIISGDTEGFRRILDVNVLAVAICTREAVANMRARRVDGHIININSVTGHAIPNLPDHLSLYPSSKYALTAMTEVVRRELISAKTNIKVTSLSPGLVKTEIMEAAEYCVENTGSPDAPTLQAKDISDAVLYVLSTPPNVQITELTIRPVGEQL
ncbi:farnesol dehydrogenase-like [Diprion similis]|uniref:farnesol dehydrogenase-like n=1 Tax=Diprion similis TaxID=362088 RepID=UPI001EF791DC|nr:farnesol dehydrogenase-like [Diprion similis]XP_046738890.1 farnesol dehydrogenase-like [Diprion similis]